MMKQTLLGSSGLRVSELSLGTMTFGTEWGWGADYETSKHIFDAYAEAGGTFIDTANRYTEGSSERFLGDFLQADRDHFVLATKYSLYDRPGDLNYAGNHRKNLFRSVEDSLRRLQTEAIDLLWIHMWDFTTPVSEVMWALDDLVRMGKVHYVGISDAPAWIVAQANTLAVERGLTPFIALQIEYSLLQRTPERDLLPMSEAFRLGITPWSPLAGGALTGKYLRNEEGRVKPESARRSDRANRIAQQVVDSAAAIGVSPAQLAIRWTMDQHPNSIPIIGARKLSQLQDCLGAVDVTIPEEEARKLEEVSAIDLGFPHDFIRQEGVQQVLYGGALEQLRWPAWRQHETPFK